MSKILGSKVEVHLKYDEEIVSGIVFDIDDEFVYIQQDVSVVITVPRENVKYYSSAKTNPVISVSPQVTHTPIPKIKLQKDQSLKVFIDKELIADIPVSDALDLSQYNGDIMNTAMSHPEVQEYLAGRTQTCGEYFPGALYIETEQDKQMPQHQSEFSMSGGGTLTDQFLSPSEMVSRFSKSMKRPPSEEEPK